MKQHKTPKKKTKALSKEDLNQVSGGNRQPNFGTQVREGFERMTPDIDRIIEHFNNKRNR
ncbi:hypothetical protein Lrub_2345 [Legionella rubrilucens]|uniref:Bacteriocin n=1 Tax=Legionella rubrilucens TaxID=458 RepID=A0A0W0XLT6_9GAMM|nr:hypothetical protein [Legionella rubrilucens]KTD45548.1 hypothetical protein Lrub_2345 [Legionella rubrilucens]